MKAADPLQAALHSLLAGALRTSLLTVIRDYGLYV